jgi:ubiquinone/menaquinone biosynthesis C-methylase UbiE
MTELHEIVKRQFDKQAHNFSSWSVTKNKEYQEAYFKFCEIVSQDTLLDFACGTGDYAIAAAPRVKYVHCEVYLNFQDYLGHARQSEESKARISRLLEKGLDNPDISKKFFIKDQNLFFKREVLCILGEK